MPESTFTYGFIGAGEMSRCIIEGLFESNPNTKIMTHCRSESTKALQHDSTILLNSNQEVIDKCDVIFIGVRPQDFGSLRGLDFKNKQICSMMCGISIDFISQVCGVSRSKIVRIMPNIAIKARKGVTGIFSDDADLQSLLSDVLSCCSIMVPCLSEDNINDIIGLSGSTQAFILHLLEGLEKFGVDKFNTDPRKIIQRVLSGVIELLEEPRSLKDIKDSICSEGGATIEGVRLMEKDGVMEAMYKACERSSNKGREMEHDLCK